MSRKVVAGNWKMNKTWNEAQDLLKDLVKASNSFPGDVKVIVATPAPYLKALSDETNGLVHLAAQNCSAEKSGAFTGEFSAQMLKSCGVNYCIVGHSERRSLYGESDQVVAAKVRACLDEQVNPIFCCGEVLEERESGKQEEVVHRQMEQALFSLSAEELSRTIIAYEPVWAIGTGKTASDEQAQEMHLFIRESLRHKFGVLADLIPILYGGSCKPSNAAGLFAQADVDGGLIGGASLNAADFSAIIDANG